MCSQICVFFFATPQDGSVIDNRTLDSLSLIDAVMPDVVSSRKTEALTKQAQSNAQQQQNSSSSSGGGGGGGSANREGANANGEEAQVNSLQGNTSENTPAPTFQMVTN